MTGDAEEYPRNKFQYDETDPYPESIFSKWYKHTMRSRRSYYIVLTLLLIIFAVLTVTVIGLSYVCLTTENQSNDKLCTTEDCLRSATMLVESMNTSVDPCNDFYQFACGNFAKMHRIPKTSISTDQFSQVYQALHVFIREYLEKDDIQTDPAAVKKARNLYQTCMDLDAIESAGLQPLLDLLKAIGLPVLGIDKSNPTKNLSKLLANIKKIVNYDILFAISVESDTKNRTFNRIALAKPTDLHTLPVHKITEELRKMSSRKIRDAYEAQLDENNILDNDLFNVILKYYRNVMNELINSEYNNSEVNITLSKEQNFRMLILMAITCSEDFSQVKNKVYDSDQDLPTIMSVDELQKFTDHLTKNASKTHERIIDWKQYLTILFADVENVTLDFETDLIQVYNIEYFESLFRTLDNVPITYTIMHLWWEVVTYVIPYTTNHMRFIQDTYFYESTGMENNPSRSLRCAESVNSMMGFAVTYALVGESSVEHNRHMLIEMIENIRWAFEKIVTELNWMDEPTKSKTLHKAQLMKTLVAFPEFLKDPKQLDEYYENFELIEDDYFGSVLAYVQRQLNATLMLLRQPNKFTTETWVSDPLDVNAYNWIQANAITVPAGILHFPFFGHDLQILNYGSLGAILGHELTHGFDNTGRQFDEGGNEHMWWTNRTINEYEKRTECFIRHYESYTVPGLEAKVNGKLTLDENIADNGGLREALWAYRKFVADHGEEPKLPGLEKYSNEQLFYLSYANTWCQTFKEGSLEQTNTLLDEHSPNYIRVVAGLTNSDEFSEIWKCPRGTRMNPDGDKCKIW